MLRLSGGNVFLAAWPVRRVDFAAFVAATGYDATGGMLTIGHDDYDWLPHGHTWENPGFPQAEDHPVVGVSHADAGAFCRWLSGHDNLPEAVAYRLPSDLEWSMAIGLNDDPERSPEERLYHDPGT